MSSDADADPCALCDRSLRDREKATKSILCRQCKKSYHVQCAGAPIRVINDLIAKKTPWTCQKCKRASFGKTAVTRSKSVSAGSSGPIDTDGDPEDSVFIVNKELSHIEEKLNSVIKIAEKNGESNSSHDAGEGTSKSNMWSQIWLKIEELQQKLTDVKSTVKEQEERISSLSKTVENQVHENALLKSEIVSVKISHELSKQKMKTGELVVCGLPLHIKDTPGQVFENICVRLNIGADAPNFGSPHTQFVKTANKSREENMLQISNLNPEVSTQLILNYRKLMKEKSGSKQRIYQEVLKINQFISTRD
ncbi:hypothetical protein DMENIID0001_005980 [Sergentomyia squamirostris]